MMTTCWNTSILCVWNHWSTLIFRTIYYAYKSEVPIFRYIPKNMRSHTYMDFSFSKVTWKPNNIFSISPVELHGSMEFNIHDPPIHTVGGERDWKIFHSIYECHKFLNLNVCVVWYSINSSLRFASLWISFFHAWRFCLYPFAAVLRLKDNVERIAKSHICCSCLSSSSVSKAGSEAGAAEAPAATTTRTHTQM